MSVAKLKIHADFSALYPGQLHVPMLYPFWGKNPETAGAPDTGRFDEYVARGSELFELTSLADSDIAVLAGEWVAGGGVPQAYEYCECARKMGKQVIIFFNNDSSEDIPVEGAIVFRTSGFRSTCRPHVYGLAAWCEDFVDVYHKGIHPVRELQDRPIIGYCGYGQIRQFFLPNGVYNALCHVPLVRRLTNQAMNFRSKVLSYLNRSNLVDTNFLLRPHFWNGVCVNGVFDIELAQKSRIEFMNNMFGSDYIMCARGSGNFSFRFYETLCSGRIPVFIDTDCLLPHDRWINWRDYCVWVDVTDIDNVAERVASFHSALTPSMFKELQQACRRLWLEWLSPMGFFSQLHRYIHEKM